MINTILLKLKQFVVSLRTYGISHSGGLMLRRNVFFDDRSRVIFGKDCLVNYGSNFHVGYKGGRAKIQIGDNVFIGMNVCITCVSHLYGISTSRANLANTTWESIEIGTGSWIGASSTILPGIKIGKGVIVAAGSVVTKDIPNNVMVGGVPAKIIRTLDSDQ